jgi:hypothetical protein
MLAILLAAMIGVPVAAGVFLVVDAGQSDRPLLRVALPAVLGVTAGALTMWVLSRLRRQEDGRKIGTIGSTLIVCAALVGSFSRQLPTPVEASMLGWVLGYFVAFDGMIVRLWRSDPKFRERFRALRT